MYPMAIDSNNQRHNNHQHHHNHHIDDHHDNNVDTTTSSTTRFLNDELRARTSAVDRFRFIIDYAGKNQLTIVQTTSFGIQAAMMLQLLSVADGIAKVPIIFIDTGYLPQETYHYAEQMKQRFGLNLHIYQSEMSPARMEALHGKLWEDTTNESSHRLYNTIRKVIPMETALRTLKASIILTGLRASQTKHRKNLSFVNLDRPQPQHVSNHPSGQQQQQQRWKVCPILDWDDNTVEEFFQAQNLPFHPLYEQGYRTVGDWHSSDKYDPSIHKSVRDTRFHGRVQECGLHLLSTSSTSSSSSSANSRSSSDVPDTIDTSLEASSFASLSLDHSSHHHRNSNNNNMETATTDGFVMYGRPNCKYCRAAKALLLGIANSPLLDQGVSITFIHVGQDISVKDLLRRLQVGRTNVMEHVNNNNNNNINNDDGNINVDHIRTVPQILYQGKRIGGYDDLVSWGTIHYNSSLSAFLELAKKAISLSTIDSIQ